MNGLKNIVGRKVYKVIRVHDYQQIFFDRGWTLDIYNPYSLNGKTEYLEDLVGLKVFSAKENVVASEIEFSNGSILQIKLDEEAYSDKPEGMELNDPKNEQIVWRFAE
jgi:hypothetical protein